MSAIKIKVHLGGRIAILFSILLFFCLITILFSGGAIIYYAVSFNWDMTGDGRDDGAIQERMRQVVNQHRERLSEEQRKDAVPWQVVAALERVYLEKKGVTFFPERWLKPLKPQFIYRSFPFVHHRYTVITECDGSGCKQYRTALQVTRPTKRFLVEKKTWKGNEVVVYQQKTEQEFHPVAKRKYQRGGKTKIFTDYLKRERYWEAEQHLFQTEDSLLQSVFDQYNFQAGDRALFSAIAKAFSPDLSLPAWKENNKSHVPQWLKPYYETMAWTWPVPNSHSVTSTFGYRQIKGREVEFHKGIDIAPSRPEITEEPVHAVGKGVVSRAEWSHGGYGWVVYISHHSGYETRYAHLARLNVEKGDQVVKGERIGIMGNTGDSTGRHLHFEVRKHGVAVNPFRVIAR